MLLLHQLAAFAFQFLLLDSFRLPASVSATEQHAQQTLQLHQHTNRLNTLLPLHRDLVRIESISGNENGIVNYLENYLKQHNFSVELQPVEPLKPHGQTSAINNAEQKPRFNILAYPGSSRKTRVLVSSHIDTVPPFWPYEVRENGDIWGRGTVDAKGCVATQIIAVEELQVSGKIKEGDVAFLFVAGEEIGGDGMRKANDLRMTWETVIFGEPTELKLASGHKGSLAFTIKAKGKAGHSGYPWLSENANSMLIPALAALDKLELPSSKKYGNTTINIGKMEGGVAANVIAETASAEIQMRLASGDGKDSKEIVIEAMTKIDKRLELDFSVNQYGPVYIDSDVEGFEKIVVNYGTDIPNLYGDHKRYLYGPGNILVAHSDHEHLTASDLAEAVDGYKKLILAALKK